MEETLVKIKETKLQLVLMVLMVFLFSYQTLFAKDEFKKVELGSPNAPVVMYDFVSLSCVHCASFHENVFPDIKKNYVDKGLVKVVFMDVPFGSKDNLFAHALLYQTKNSEEFFTLAMAILQEQRKWVSSPDATKLLSSYARLIGISDKGIENATKNEALLKWLISDAQKNLTDLKIEGTPTMIIVKKGSPIGAYSAKISGAASYKKISAEFDKLLK